MLTRTVKNYELALHSIPRTGSGIGGLWDDLVGVVTNAGKAAVGTANAVIDTKTAKLENALTLITVLSAVAAGASVYTLLRRR